MTTAADVTELRELARETATAVQRLRDTQIPQHLGMAAAARALATDLPRVLAAQAEADLTNGALALRWDAAHARAAEQAAAGGTVDPTLAAVMTLLAAQAQIAARYLAVRAEEWTADVYRFEGQATALEQQTDRLRALASVEPPAEH